MSRIQTFYWHRQPAIDAALLREFADSLGPGKLVVDVGAGYDPWPYATEFVDREAWPALAGKKVHVLDVELDRLPYADKSVDFLYCRHCIEDLHNPTLLLREMNRVAKAGYIETPSPLAEFCRGSEGPDIPWRGFHHHRWFCWLDGERLTLLPKYGGIETMRVPEATDEQIVLALNTSGFCWNTSLAWRDMLDFRILREPADFTFEPKYVALLNAAASTAVENARRFVHRFDLEQCEMVGSERVAVSSPR